MTRLAMSGLFVLIAVLESSRAGEPMPKRPHVLVRGIYGGVPSQILERGKSLDDYGVNAVWVGSGGLSKSVVETLKAQGAKVFAEFNTMHDAGFLKARPDASPIGPDGEICPAPNGWQGICPSHPEYRRARMEAFRKTLAEFPIDGIWLDYHHAHASWEQAEPMLPDTCFCKRCLERFQAETGVELPSAPTSEISKRLLGPLKARWFAWRRALFTDWVREFREILDRTRPGALLGTFHCPWSEDERDGAIRDKLAIDLKAQSKYLDVFSIMPYHARFGHADDPAWVSRQSAALGKLLGIEGKPGERLKIWPIVQLSNWGEKVPVEQVETVLDHGSRSPSTGLMVFVWSTLHPEWEKVESMGKTYREIRP